jgi:acetoin utilization deacetylase AcuC-like enzyme
VTAAARRTGIVLDDRVLTHRNPPGGVAFGTYPAWATVEPFERPERISLTRQVLEGSGVLEHVSGIDAREATRPELESAHSADHVTAVLGAAGIVEPLQLGHEAWIGPGSLQPALLAVGGLLEAVAAVLEGRCDNAFVLARPPGHHAVRDAAMGFCLFNANAIAARIAQRVHGVRRVAILDWDVHHGNGTEAIFYDDASVLTVSLHQDGLYPPSSGVLGARGSGPGEGANANVPLPAFTGDEGYLAAWDEVVDPLVRRFEPDLILVGAGQDAAASDPLGKMAVTLPAFRALADRVVALAGDCCGGRLVAFLEGGYSLQHTPLANLAILEGLAGLPGSFTHDWVATDVPVGVSDAVRAAIRGAARVHLGGASG